MKNIDKKLNILNNEIKALDYLLDVKSKTNLITTVNIKGDDLDLDFNVSGDIKKLLKVIKVDKLREISNIENAESDRIVVYCDGSSYPQNPGHMGLGIVMLDYDGNNTELSLYGGEGTNNQSEMLATIMSIRQYPEGSKLEIRTDSMYVVKGITEWIHNWILNGYLKNDGSKIKNIDLWKVLYNLNKRYDIDYVWVKGHQEGEFLNSKSDKLARIGATKDNRIEDMEIIYNSYFEELLNEKII